MNRFKKIRVTGRMLKIVIVGLVIVANALLIFAEECTSPTVVESMKFTTATLSADGIMFTITPVVRVEPNGWVVAEPGKLHLSVVSSQRQICLANFYQYRLGYPPPPMRLRPVKAIPLGYSVNVEVLPGDFLHFWAVVFDKGGQCFITRTLVVKVPESSSSSP